jgi:hypothetical protein
VEGLSTLSQHFDAPAVTQGGEDGYWDFSRRLLRHGRA